MCCVAWSHSATVPVLRVCVSHEIYTAENAVKKESKNSPSTTSSGSAFTWPLLVYNKFPCVVILYSFPPFFFFFERKFFYRPHPTLSLYLSGHCFSVGVSPYIYIFLFFFLSYGAPGFDDLIRWHPLLLTLPLYAFSVYVHITHPSERLNFSIHFYTKNVPYCISLSLL